MERGFCYEQRTGQLSLVNGDYVIPLFTGYAGFEGGRNLPEAQAEKNRGPLPRGDYDIRRVAHPRFKAPALELRPFIQNQMFGRSGFFIHGGSVSHGCIIINGAARSAVAALVDAGFSRLRVIE